MTDPEKEREFEGRAAARGTLFTLLLRLVSFACTQATFRVLDPETLGKANIQLELLLTSVLFMSREGFRLSLTRNISEDSWNVAWLTIPVVTLVAGGALVWHGFMASDQDYMVAGTLYCLASWIEGAAEPAVLYFLRNMDVPKRASAESLATVAKTTTTILGLSYVDAKWHVTIFGIAQLIYALSYTTYLYSKAWSKLPRPTSSFDRRTCGVTLIFTLQGFFKHILTEADRIVLTAISDSYDQGVYAMGSSYGGMAARILLQPMEENARLLWSRQADRHDTTDLETSYTVLVKLVLYIGLVFGCIAVNYTNLLLSVLAGRRWGTNEEAAAVLSAFCVYTAFLACNGMTEAFVYAVTSSGIEIGKLGMVHSITGVVFGLVASYFVSRYGTVGLVGANCVAMTVRLTYSLSFTAGYFGSRQSVSRGEALQRLLGRIIPHPAVIVCFVVAWASTRWSLGKLREEGMHLGLDIGNKEWLSLTAQHLAIGISCVVGIATVASSLEGTFLRSLRSMFRTKQD